MQQCPQGLAKAIAWDGEGATCLIEVTAKGASSNADARKVAKSVVSSSLVKAAMFGHDPNWGRIGCAAGCVSLLTDQCCTVSTFYSQATANVC